MVKEMPEVKFYTYYFWRDSDNISSATYDFGQPRFQTSLFISEIARLHKYIEKGSGPCNPEYLMEYISKLIPNHPVILNGKLKLYKQLLPLWNKTHQEIFNKADRYTSFR
jgi:hypothetical protein